MKVRLFHLAVLAAIATAGQAAAQEPGGDLERALADLNRGLVAPQGAANNVSANASSSLQFGGDIRVRNTWLNEIGAAATTSTPAVDGSPDRKNVDARMRMHAAFDVNEHASAFVQLIASENWGNATGAGPNAATNETSNLDTGSISQAWFSGKSIIFDEEEWTFGRRYYTLGSGRIIGTDDWDQNPSSYSGAWYSHPLYGWNLNLWMITDAFNLGGVNGRFGPVGDTDVFGAAVNYSTDAVEALGTINIKPYILRMTTQDAATGTKNWFGGQVTGAISAVDYDVELVWVDSDRQRDPEISSYTGWAVDLGIRLGEWIQDVPGNIDPRIEVGAAAADKAGVALDPVYHNTAGIFDLQNRSGRPGVWGGEADTYQGALALTPAAEWEARIAYIHFNDNDESNAFNTDAEEIDLSVSHTFHNEMALWLGWALVDVSGSDPNAYVVYATLGLPF